MFCQPQCYRNFFPIAGGAQLQYSQIKFSYSGNYLAACSDLPDFNLFLWDWKTGKLRCKEKVGEEVYAIQTTKQKRSFVNSYMHCFFIKR